jgi:hypothetical protein
MGIVELNWPVTELGEDEETRSIYVGAVGTFARTVNDFGKIRRVPLQNQETKSTPFALRKTVRLENLTHASSCENDLVTPN